MEFAFYICSLIAILTTLLVIKQINPIHMLLYLIISFLATSGVFFSLGAYFAGVIEVIIYTGAIVVLFVFVVMVLNTSDLEINQECELIKPKMWIGSSIISILMLIVIVYAIMSINDQNIQNIDGTPILIKEVGMALFGPYMLVVELVSMLLLAGLIISFHIGRERYLNIDKTDINHLTNNKK